MKKSFLFLALVLLFSQCQVPPIIQSPTPIAELEGVCDSISSNKYFPGQNFRVFGDIVIDYNSVQIDSSDNDSVFIYVNISAQLDMAFNTFEQAHTPNALPLDTPTHVCIHGGPCTFLGVTNPNHLSHSLVFKFSECTVFKMVWSNVAGLLKSTNSVKMLVLAQPKIGITGQLHDAMKPNYILWPTVNNLMYNKNWWVILINNKTQRYVGGYMWDFH